MSSRHSRHAQHTDAVSRATSSAISIQSMTGQTIARTAQPAANTNPAITALSNGGYLAAFQGSGSSLYTYSGNGTPAPALASAHGEAQPLVVGEPPRDRAKL
jgi:hypothetical protein